jgi:hypothetical protein
MVGMPSHVWGGSKHARIIRSGSLTMRPVFK